MRNLAAIACVAMLAGPALADTASAVRAYDAGAFDIVAVEFQREAKSGDAEAQYRLGLMYADGVWYKADRAEAMR